MLSSRCVQAIQIHRRRAQTARPAFVTAAGSVGTVTGGSAITPIDVVAADPESAGTVIFDVLTGGLPAGLSSTTVHENGVSKSNIRKNDIIW